MKKNAAIILAGGSGARLNDSIPKQFLEIRGKTIIAHTIGVFEHHPLIHEIFVVTNPEFLSETRIIVAKEGFSKVKSVTGGGKTRQQSSYIGVISAAKADCVLIHDAARPLVSHNIIGDLIAGLEEAKALVTAVPSSDTIIEIDSNSRITRIPQRKWLRRVQTPQAFHKSIIREAHEKALDEGVEDAPDDSFLVLTFNLAPIQVIPGSQDNIKITYPGDLPLAEQIFLNQQE